MKADKHKDYIKLGLTAKELADNLNSVGKILREINNNDKIPQEKQREIEARKRALPTWYFEHDEELIEMRNKL